MMILDGEDVVVAEEAIAEEVVAEDEVA